MYWWFEIQILAIVYDSKNFVDVSVVDLCCNLNDSLMFSGIECLYYDLGPKYPNLPQTNDNLICLRFVSCKVDVGSVHL